MPIRTIVLPDHGSALIVPDLHGNLEDFRTAAGYFGASSDIDAATHVVFLGDVVHGPNADARQTKPDLYDFDDASMAVVEGILRLRADHPHHVHYVLGNHDYGHVGGPTTTKFHADEVAYLESRHPPDAVDRLRALFGSALLAVTAPCGVLMAHGSPGLVLRQLCDLDDVTFPAPPGTYHDQLMDDLLTSYGQREEVTEQLLRRISTPEVTLRVVVHGHDRDECGYFVDGSNQACPVIFGAPRDRKTILRLDLGARYSTVRDFREGREIVRIYAPR